MKIKNLLIILLLVAQIFGGEIMSIYDIEVKDIDGQEVKLDKYKGRVVLIVNVVIQVSMKDCRSFILSIILKV